MKKLILQKYIPCLLPQTLAMTLGLSPLLAAVGDATPIYRAPQAPVGHFQLVATFETGSVAEIVDATPDGQMLVYTDSEAKRIGFVGIHNPAAPVALSTMDVGGEPTSVAVTPDGRYALVCVRLNPDLPVDYDKLLVVDLSDLSQAPLSLPLDGQPDCVSVSPDGRYAAIAIENERNEDLNEGEMPQLPPGFLTIVDLAGEPTQWTLRDVDLRGLASRFTEDPEPEFVSIREDNVAAVTLQENNHIVLVDLPTGLVINHFSAGTTTHAADLTNDGAMNFSETLTEARLEPDAIGWTPGGKLVTANEGDYSVDLEPGQYVGGRNFTMFNTDGQPLFDCGAQLEMAAAAAGLYSDSRSSSKGTEPEGIEIARYLNHTYMFVGMERARAVGVYRLDGVQETPRFIQVLKTGTRPEGLLAIPQRALFDTANEGDGTLSIFAGKPGNP